MMVSRLDLLAGVALDLVIGDPHWFPHPVRVFGWAATRLERLLRATGLPLKAAGFLFWVSTVMAAAWLVGLTLPWANIYWIYSLLALRSLDVESARVVEALSAGDIPAARQQLGMIVGRDTANLDEQEILRAVLETVSENVSDGVIAPLFYLAIGGPGAMAFYKAVNTLDSMVGHKNERYRDFGWTSAKLDDAANFVPARLAAILVCLAAPIVGLSARRAVRVTVRDGDSQPSPNAGYPEAAFAGALGVRLGGLNFYGGVPYSKATLGDTVRPLGIDVYRQARHLLYATSLLAVALLCVL